MAQIMNLSQDFKEFVELLDANQVRYLVVGGYAVAIHGHPRYTKDLDVWIDPDPINAVHVVEALEQFGFGSLNLVPDDFVKFDQIIQLGYPPLRIDLITSIAGVDFQLCYDNRISVDVGGVLASFIGIDDLRRNKAASGRPQDLADLDKLR